MRGFAVSSLSLRTLSGRVMLGLMMLAMIYRGAVPMGYMLTPGDATSGKLMVTFCVAGGAMVSMPLELPGAPHPPADSEASVLECPFAVAAAQFILPSVAPGLVPSGTQARPAPFLAYTSAPALPAQGPPLGSRAPPLNLV